MIGRALCAIGRHKWSPWHDTVNVAVLGPVRHAVCVRDACQGRTARLEVLR